MRIKNTKELRARAAWHARHDHIKQGTYGKGNVNGTAEYRGCAIGCLSTPHTKKGLRAFMKGLLPERFHGRQFSMYGFATYGSRDAYDMLKDLKREFGLTPALMRVAEAIFEAHGMHGAAIEFIPRFAKALPEGADITPRMVNAFWRTQFPSDYVDYDNEFVDADSATYPRNVKHAVECERALLRWLRSKAPALVTKEDEA